MGLLLSVRGADFSGAPVAYIPAVERSAEYLNYFGAGSEPGRNLIAGKAKGQVVGAPGFGSGFASFRGATNFIRTGVLDQAAATLLAVARAPNLQDGTFGFAVCSFNGSGTAAGSNMLIDRTLRQMGVHASRDVSGTPQVVQKFVATSVDGWVFYSVRAGNAYHRIDDKTNGRSGIGPIDWPRSAPNGLPYLIGSGHGGVQGLIDIAYAAIHSAELTDAEIEASYQQVKAALATKSIIV